MPLLSPFRAVRRPRWPYAIRRQSPQARGLAFWVPIRADADVGVVRDVVRPVTGTPIGAAGATSGTQDEAFTFGLACNGTTGYIDFGTQTWLNPNRDFTISAWVKPSSVSGNRSILSHGQTGWYLRLASGKLNILQASTADILIGTTTLGTGVWTHVAATVGTGGAVALYVNGVLDGTSTTAVTFGSANVLALGADLFGATAFEFFAGSLCDIRVYTTAISAALVNQMWQPVTRWDLYATPFKRVLSVASAGNRRRRVLLCAGGG